MPIYIYKCENGHKTELMQGIKTKPLDKCPECGKEVKKVITKTSFQFKQP